MVHAVTDTINKALRDGMYPGLAKAMLVALYKGKGDRADPSLYRGIAMQNLVPKILSTLLSARLSHWAEWHGLIWAEQIGFKHSCGSEYHVMALLETLKARARDSRTTSVLFVDFYKAYDSVHPEAVWLALTKMGVPPGLVELLREEGVTQTARPVQVLVHAVEDLGESEHGLHAGIPGPILGRAHRILALELRVRTGEAGRLHHLERVGGGHQHLGEELVGIQRDGREHLVELGLCEQRNVFRFGGLGGPHEDGEDEEERGKKARREGDHTLFLAGRNAGPVRWNGRIGRRLTRPRINRRSEGRNLSGA
jgi:hypothetical protein